MFDSTSRYYSLRTYVEDDGNGNMVTFKGRRALPPPRAVQGTLSIPAQRNDRLDSLAARTLGSPELFWRLCDANGVLNPIDTMENMPKLLFNAKSGGSSD